MADRAGLSPGPQEDVRVKVIGIDLSGPSNTADTAAAWFGVTATGLAYEGGERDLGDQAILDRVAVLARQGDVIVGLDAPLGYNPGGGDRPADRSLRKAIMAAGLASGSVMTPTFSRMAYLTLRGVSIARALEHAVPRARIVEVHPGAAMALRGASIAAVRSFKKERRARATLAHWLAAQGLAGLPTRHETDHELAAAACGLAAWKWSRDESVWHEPRSGALAPYDFAC